MPAQIVEPKPGTSMGCVVVGVSVANWSDVVLAEEGRIGHGGKWMPDAY